MMMGMRNEGCCEGLHTQNESHLQGFVMGRIVKNDFILVRENPLSLTAAAAFAL